MLFGDAAIGIARKELSHMTRMIQATIGAALLLGLGPIAPADAQSRVFVAAQGSDGNACTFAAPCRTLQHAHNVVAANGEIDVLDPAGYGTLTITKAISIQGHGFSGISAASGNAITINAGASDHINLRGLLIDGFATGANGIAFSTGGSLNIEDTLVRNFASSGISFAPNAASTFSVVNTHLVANGSHGVSVIPIAGNITVSGTFEHVLTARNGGDGFLFNGGTGLIMRFTIANSTISDNTFHGVVAAGSGSDVQVMVRSSVVSNQIHGDGLLANGSALLSFSSSTVMYNETGIQTLNGALVESFGDNVLRGPGGPTSTVPLK
jgi:hypothetical protein